MPDRSWTLLRSQDVLDQRIFRLRSDPYRFEPSGEEQEFMVLDTPSWVNVVPITTGGNVVLIRQYRHSIQDVTLEIPGGMIDDGEEPEAAAARELLEETGYVAETIRPLARVVPNPAVQDNYLYLFVADQRHKEGRFLHRGGFTEAVRTVLNHLPPPNSPSPAGLHPGTGRRSAAA